MRKNDQAKTILTILPDIGRYCDGVARANHARALASFNTCTDTQQLMESIIDRAYKSQVLHNLKIKVEKQLESAPKKLGAFITAYFIEKKKIAQVATELGLCERTVFRKIDDAIEWFATKLERCGVTQDFFGHLILTFGWVAAIYNSTSPR